MQQGTSAISASISARYQSVTNSYRCNEYETQPPPRLATLSLSLSLFSLPAMTYNLVYIYIVGEEGLAKLNQTACILCTPNT